MWVVERLGLHTILEKILLIRGEWTAGRTTVVLVRERVGVWVPTPRPTGHCQTERRGA